MELEAEHGDNNNDEDVGNEACQDTGTVPWCVNWPEYTCPNDPTNSSTADEGRRRECSFPLSTNVVGLVGQESRAICVGGYGGKEDAEITNSVVLVVAQESEPKDTYALLELWLKEKNMQKVRTNGSIENDDGATQMPPISKVCLDKHDNGSSTIGWSN